MKDFAKRYHDLLTGEYAGINLTRISDFDEFLDKQIQDSIIPLDKSEAFNTALQSTKLMVDVGFGGGFPILPMAFKNPDVQFIGIETRGKKVKVVQEIANKLGLKNVKLIHKRIEECIIDIPVVCTLKAVGKVEDFLNKFNSTKKIQVYFYKGPNFYTLERDQIENIKQRWDTIEEIELDIPNTVKRIFVGYSNKNVPCGTNLGKKSKETGNLLVKLSDLL